MAQSVTETLIDDIDQSKASETVRFGVDGTAYEINLSAKHTSELRSLVGRLHQRGPHDTASSFTGTAAAAPDAHPDG